MNAIAAAMPSRTARRRRGGGRRSRSERATGDVRDGCSDVISRWMRTHARAFAASSAWGAPSASRILSNSSMGLGVLYGDAVWALGDLCVASIRCFPHGGEQFPKRRPGPMDPRANAPDRDGEDVGGLPVGELSEGDQHEGAALLLAKLRERLAQDRREPGSVEGLDRDRIGCLALLRKTGEQVVLAPLRTQVMPGHVVGDPEEPGPRGRVPEVIGGPTLERDQEGLSRGLLARIATEDPLSEPADRLIVPLEDLPELLGILEGVTDQLGVGRVSAGHDPSGFPAQRGHLVREGSVVRAVRRAGQHGASEVRVLELLVRVASSETLPRAELVVP